MWRGGGRLGMSVSAPFVWRCLSGSTMAPFPHPAHRTGHADFPHPALGQDVTPSPTTGQEFFFAPNAMRGNHSTTSCTDVRALASSPRRDRSGCECAMLRYFGVVSV